MLPAAMQDAYPLEGQCTYRHLVAASLSALLPIVGTRPGGFVDGLCGPVNKGLAHEGRTLPAPVHPG